MNVDRKDLKALEASFGGRVREFLAPMALRTTQFVGEALIGLFVMVLATYYFFADGPAMLRAILRLSPIEGGRTQELIDQFDSVTRAVVMATLLSALVQGLLAGGGLLRGRRRLGVPAHRPDDVVHLGAVCGRGHHLGSRLSMAVRRRGSHPGGCVFGCLLHCRSLDRRQSRQAAGVARPLESTSIAGIAECPWGG